jgi:hypothetical protein
MHCANASACVSEFVALGLADAVGLLDVERCAIPASPDLLQEARARTPTAITAVRLKVSAVMFRSLSRGAVAPRSVSVRVTLWCGAFGQRKGVSGDGAGAGPE